MSSIASRSLYSSKPQLSSKRKLDTSSIESPHKETSTKKKKETSSQSLHNINNNNSIDSGTKSHKKNSSNKKYTIPRRVIENETVYDNQLEYLRSLIAKREEKRRLLLEDKDKRVKNRDRVDSMTPYGELDDLIDKWRTACQEALTDLQKRVNGGRGGASVGSTHLGIHQLLAHFHIDEELIRFDRDSEDFY